MNTLERIRPLENFHIVLWLVKDICWCTLSKSMGVIMIAPTVVFAIIITWKARKVKSEFWHNLAVLFWLCANSTWMVGEFFYNDSTRKYALFFFVLGLISIAYYYTDKYYLSKIFTRKKNRIQE